MKKTEPAAGEKDVYRGCYWSYTHRVGNLAGVTETHSVPLDIFRKLHRDEVRIGRGLPSDRDGDVMICFDNQLKNVLTIWSN